MSEEKEQFASLGLTRQFINALEDKGYQKATLIQQKAIPLINAGHDILGIAPTGTGKTAAFVLPILQKLKYAQGMAPRAVIISPSKELVMQIHENIVQYATYTDLRAVCIYGGIGPKKQIEELSKGCDIITSTPAHFLELYKRGAFQSKLIKTMVLDEADKLMDMGFTPQIRNMLEILPPKRQNLLFSATFPDKVARLSDEFLDFPEKIEVAPQSSTADTITQSIYHTPNFKTKIRLLGELLADEETFHKVIVFTNTKATADNIFKFVGRKVSDDVRVIHSNKAQNSRINAIKDFKDGSARILITTDVAARGIDIPDVSHVIIFEIPTKFEEYVHRVGRTGRAFKAGQAISFANKGERYYVTEIEKVIKQKIPVVQFPDGFEPDETPKEEIIEIERMIDSYKKWKDPSFKGAFHEKKQRFFSDKKGKGKNTKAGKKPNTGRGGKKR